jgi:hypothetical protein
LCGQPTEGDISPFEGGRGDVSPFEGGWGDVS